MARTGQRVGLTTMPFQGMAAWTKNAAVKGALVGNR